VTAGCSRLLFPLLDNGGGQRLDQMTGHTKANMFELRDKSALTQGNSTKVHQKM
jgi:hypothetical protein